MATKVKPSRLNVTGTPQVGQVPMYVDADNFQWGSSGSGGYGRFLSLWDASTGLPDSFPEATPYTYLTGDYYLVTTVSSATPPVNYRPTGSSYTGTASSTVESDELEVGDVYIYDGSVWLLQSNHGKTVSFANIAGDAMDNVNLSGYLNVKAFYLSSTSDLTTAQAAFEWQNGGKTAIVVYSNKPYAFSFYNTAQMDFVCLLYREQLEAGNNKTSLVRDVITFSVTGGTTVSSISAVGWNNIIASVLKTDTNYSTPYTPQYDGSPATKKYVDDNTQYVTQAEYTALLPGAASDGKHYFIYTSSGGGGGWQPGANTLVYYNINDNDTTSTIYDLTANNIDQTWSSTGSYSTDATYGRVADFNGAQHTQAGSIVNFGNSYTLITLVKVYDTSFQIAIVMEGASSGRPSVGFDIVGGKPGTWSSNGANGYVMRSDSAISTNQWIMLACTRASDNTLKLYVNGALVKSATAPENPQYSTGATLRISSWRESYYQFSGQFKMFIGEDRTWTDAEIAALAEEYGFTVS